MGWMDEVNEKLNQRKKNPRNKDDGFSRFEKDDFADPKTANEIERAMRTLAVMADHSGDFEAIIIGRKRGDSGDKKYKVTVKEVDND